MVSTVLTNKIDKRIRKFFSSRWSATDANFFLKKTGYQLDIASIQKNLNLPIRDFVLRGGKRIRPVLFIQTLRAFGVNYEKYLDLAKKSQINDEHILKEMNKQIMDELKGTK